MDAQPPTAQMSIGQLGHHPGLHLTVNLEGKTVGGVLFEAEQWVPGVVVGLSASGDYVTIELDPPVGDAQKLISIDDPQRVRPLTLGEAQPGGVPADIVELVRAGKTLKAIKQYRALNGATLDEARAAIAKL
jgi:hypothetical protein